MGRGFKRLFKRRTYIYQCRIWFYQCRAVRLLRLRIYTGTTPYYNGIPSNRWMDRGSLRIIKSVDDRDFYGVYTSESSSAKLLRCSTLSDELKVATQGRAEVYSIAPTREMAIWLPAMQQMVLSGWMMKPGSGLVRLIMETCPLWVSKL